MVAWRSKKPETINYRTLKPERDGLFCERILDPRRIGNAIAENISGFVTKGKFATGAAWRSRVRRCAGNAWGILSWLPRFPHIWYFKGIPSRMGLVLDVSPRMLEKVLYFALYIVLDPGNVRELQKKQLLTEKEYRDMRKI